VRRKQTGLSFILPLMPALDLATFMLASALVLEMSKDSKEVTDEGKLSREVVGGVPSQHDLLSR
jgi:hypothetical protein